MAFTSPWAGDESARGRAPWLLNDESLGEAKSAVANVTRRLVMEA